MITAKDDMLKKLQEIATRNGDLHIALGDDVDFLTALMRRLRGTRIRSTIVLPNGREAVLEGSKKEVNRFRREYLGLPEVA